MSKVKTSLATVDSSWLMFEDLRREFETLPADRQIAKLIADAHKAVEDEEKATDLLDIFIEGLVADEAFKTTGPFDSLLKIIRELAMRNANAAFEMRMKVSLLALKTGHAREVPHV